MKNSFRLVAALSVLLLALSLSVRAQSNVGIIRGMVKDQNGAAIAGAHVRLSNPITNYAQAATSDTTGAFQLVYVPLNHYTLAVEASGFETNSREVVVRSNLVQQIAIQMGVAPVQQTVEVTGERELLDTEKSAPTTVLDRNRVLTFPTAQPSRATEELIAPAPGWTMDANGRLHARGIEYQVQYSIDGVPVTDTIADTFASSPDPRNFRSVEVTTAYIPAEYGNKLAGVIDVTTRSGLEIPRSGNVTFSGGSFETVEGSFDVGGHTRKLGYFLSLAGTSTNRFLDPPTLENFHNRGRSVKGFFKFDYAPTSKDLLRLNLFVDGQKFEVPNLP